MGRWVVEKQTLGLEVGLEAVPALELELGLEAAPALELELELELGLAAAHS